MNRLYHRRRMFLFLGIALCSWALWQAFGLVNPVAAAVPPLSCSPSFQAVDSPNFGDSSTIINGVSGTGDDVWAVGFTANGAAVTLHWDGTAWTEVANPAPQFETELNAVSGSGNDVWAVGSYAVLGNSTRLTFTLHWNGSSWARVSAPNASSNDNVLNSVSGTGNDVWAVGYYDDGAVTNTLTLHWNGSQWLQETSPNVSTVNNELAGVSGSGNDVWAVGYFDDADENQQTLILHWNGTSWSTVTSPNVDTQSNQLNAVSGTGTDVWAVGTYYDTDDNNLTLTLHWNGTVWSNVNAPFDGTLNSVSGTGSDVWAVGIDADGSSLLLHWNGSAWALATSPASTRFTILTGVSGSGNDVWAVGFEIDGFIAAYSLTLHYDGTAWSKVASPNGGGNENELLGVSGSGSDVWAVGYYYSTTGDQTLALHWDGTAWTRFASPSPGDYSNGLQAVTGGGNDVWAVGYTSNQSDDFYSPLILHWDGSQWTQVANPVSAVKGELTGVSGSGNDVWAVGYYDESSAEYTAGETLILHWDGTSWTKASSPDLGAVDVDLAAVTGSGSDVWAVGYYVDRDSSEASHPLTLHFDGSSWTQVSSPSVGTASTNLYGVSGSGNDVWAVGYSRDNDASRIALTIHWDGTQWTRVLSAAAGLDSELYAVTGSGSDVWAVGDYEGSEQQHTLTMHWDGATWSRVASPDSNSNRQLYAVSGSGTDVWAVGGSYSIDTAGQNLTLHYSCNIPPASCIAGFQNVPSPNFGAAGTTLLAVTGSGNDVWAVGEYQDRDGRTLTMHWDGTTWTHVPSPNVGVEPNHLTAVTGSGNDVWAVGWYQENNGNNVRPLTMHWDGTSWTRIGAPNTGQYNRLNAVSGAGDDVWAVGSSSEDSGQAVILHWNGSYWSRDESVTSRAELNAVSGSGSDVWAVGQAFNGNGFPYTLHYDGTAWTEIVTPDIGTTGGQLLGVRGTGSDVWAVGFYYDDSYNSHSLALHYDGSEWTQDTTVPDVGRLSAVSGTGSDVWAVSAISTQILHWDGTSWTQVDGLAGGPTNGRLNGVSGSGNDVWAVGVLGDNLSFSNQMLTLHRNGSGWSRVATPAVGSGYNFLSAVSGSGNDVWAVGNYSDEIGNGGVLTLHWNGTNWTAVANPFDQARGTLNGVSGSGNDVWAVGYSEDDDENRQTLTMRWNGTAWSTVTSPNVGTQQNQLNAVSGTGDDVWAVGYYQEGVDDNRTEKTLILHWDGTAWTPSTSPNPGSRENELLGVSGTGNDVWAVGYYSETDDSNYSLALHWNGTSWSRVTSAEIENGRLKAVSGSGSDVWAVGDYYESNTSKTLTMHWAGSQWTQVASPNQGATDSFLNGVSGMGSDVWAVGYSFAAGNYDFSSVLTMHWDGTSWNAVAGGGPSSGHNELYAVTGSGSDVWAVGNYRYPSSTGQTLTLHYPCAVNVYWNDLVHATDANNGVANSTITRDNSSAAWSGGAASSLAIGAEPGYGYAEARVGTSTSTAVFGLGAGNDDQTPNDIDFGIWFSPSRNAVDIVQGGRKVCCTPALTYTLSDTFRVAIEPGASNKVVNYYRISSVGVETLLYSNTAPTLNYPLRFDSALYSPGASLVAAVIAGPNLIAPTVRNSTPPGETHDVHWQNASSNVDAVDGPPSSITRTVGIGWDAGASSVESFNSYFGAVEATVGSADGYFFFGIGKGDTDQGKADVDYAFYGYPETNLLLVYYQGQLVKPVGDLNLNDKLRIEFSGGKVRFYSNDQPVLVGNIVGDDAANLPALLDTSLYNPGAKLDNVKIWYTDTMKLQNSAQPQASSAEEVQLAQQPQQLLDASFSDVHNGDYFYGAVQYLASHGVVSGYGDGTFRPYNSTTRGQLAKMVVLASGGQLANPSVATFSDVPVGSTFFSYVETALSRRMISGYADGTFRPNANVTRGQLTKMVLLGLLLPVTGGTTAHFNDVATNSPFFRYIETAYELGLVSGYGDGSFGPNNSATRGQIAKVVYLGAQAGQ